MERKVLFFLILLMFAGIFGGIDVQASEARDYKVLIVMSYHEEMPWVQEMKEGLDRTLTETCELKYMYLDTRRNMESAPAKAEEIYRVYQEFQPDGVIAADDNAQELFVVPYLKDKVDTPVMFCGVNADPQDYGYPASNVSGILERMHIKESIIFLQQIVPSVKTVGFLTGENSTAKADQRQVKKEAEAYPVATLDFTYVKTLEEAIAAAKALKTRCDALYIEHIIGIKDRAGHPLDEKTVIPMLAEAFGKPTFGANLAIVTYGLLCAVVKTGQEQGRVVSEMLLKAMSGTPASEIPVTRNQLGRRVINVSVLQALGIKPKHHVLLGTELVKTNQ